MLLHAKATWLDRSRRRGQPWALAALLVTLTPGTAAAEEPDPVEVRELAPETPVSDPGVVGTTLMATGGLGIFGGFGLGIASLLRPEAAFGTESPSAGDMRTASAVSLGVGLGLFAAGAGIFVLDPSPSVLSGVQLHLGPAGGGCAVSF